MEMGKEDEIRNYLLSGRSPTDIINMGYSKSTVYKIYRELASSIVQIPPPRWTVYIQPFEPRVPPGSKIALNVTLENRSGMDMYLYRIGFRTEWMNTNEWYAHVARTLIKHGDKRSFNFMIEIPPTIPLGEYSLSFGIEAQYLPSSQLQQLNVEWSMPTVIHVKQPLNGTKIFISHSVKDMWLVRELEKQLDNYGFEPIIAEERPQPGVFLDAKVRNMVSQANMVLVLFTENGIRSQWVWKEVQWAIEMEKPLIPLKEASVPKEVLGPLANLEWIEFSKTQNPYITSVSVTEKIQRLLQQQNVPAILGLTFIALLLLFLLGSKS